MKGMRRDDFKNGTDIKMTNSWRREEGNKQWRNETLHFISTSKVRSSAITKRFWTRSQSDLVAGEINLGNVPESLGPVRASGIESETSRDHMVGAPTDRPNLLSLSFPLTCDPENIWGTSITCLLPLPPSPWGWGHQQTRYTLFWINRMNEEIFIQKLSTARNELVIYICGGGTSPRQLYCVLPECIQDSIKGKPAFARYTRVYQKVPGLAAWIENCKWYNPLPLRAVVSLFCESV
jgi:hypothetical protein